MQLTCGTDIEFDSDYCASPSYITKLAEGVLPNGAGPSLSSSSSSCDSNSNGTPITNLMNDIPRLGSAEPRASSAPISSSPGYQLRPYSSDLDTGLESRNGEELPKLSGLSISAIAELSVAMTLPATFTRSNSNHAQPKRLSCWDRLGPRLPVPSLTTIPVETLMAIADHLSVRDLCNLEMVSVCSKLRKPLNSDMY
jgi:hypothetical protein